MKESKKMCDCPYCDEDGVCRLEDPMWWLLCRWIIHCISEAHYESEAEARLQAEEWFMDRYPHTTIESEDKNISCESCAYSDLD